MRAIALYPTWPKCPGCGQTPANRTIYPDAVGGHFGNCADRFHDYPWLDDKAFLSQAALWRQKGLECLRFARKLYDEGFSPEYPMRPYAKMAAATWREEARRCFVCAASWTRASSGCGPAPDLVRFGA